MRTRAVWAPPDVDPIPWVPKPYHEIGLEFMLANSRAAVWFDPGLGKTAITLAAFTILQQEQIARQMVVVAPIRPCHSVWPREVQKWADFAHLTCTVLHGPRKNKEIEAVQSTDVVVVNYEGLEWYSREMHERGYEFPDVWVFDESTAMKHYGTIRFEVVTGRRKRGRPPWPHPPLMDYFKRCYELTGTPSPNGYSDLWGQMFLLDGGASLGRYITDFRNAWMWQNPNFRQQYEFIPAFAPKLFETISHLVVRMDRKDWRTIEAPIINDIHVSLPPDVLKQYRKLEKEFAVDLDETSRVIAPSTMAKLSKMRQLASGGIYYEASAEWNEFVRVRKSKWMHDAKLDALVELLEELSGEPLLLAYAFRTEIDAVRKKLGYEVPNMSGTKGAEADVLVQEWNEGLHPLLLGHPKSMGHGLNMQEGNAHHAGHFSLTYNLEHYDQFNARLDRDGQEMQCVIHHFVADDTVDSDVAEVLGWKDRSQQDLLDAVKALGKRRMEE